MYVPEQIYMILIRLDAKLIKEMILKGSIANSDLPSVYREKANAKRRQHSEMRSAASFFADEFTEEDLAQAARHVIKTML